jgi:hypothetical protein
MNVRPLLGSALALVAILALSPLSASAQFIAPDSSVSKTVSTLNAEVRYAPLNGRQSCTATPVGNFVGTLSFEGSTDELAWAPIAATLASGGGGLTATTTLGVSYVANVVHVTAFRVRVSSYASGSAIVSVKCSNQPAPQNQAALLFLTTGMGVPSGPCTPPTMYFRQNGSVGANIYVCSSSGTWTAFSGI